jgi:hypothetical protein
MLLVSNDTLSLAQHAAQEIDTDAERLPSPENTSKRCQKIDNCTEPCPDRERPEVSPTPVFTAPCKLISRLAENPSTDITQFIVGNHEMDEYAPTDGVECSKAHQMLMKFATTEEKLDTACRALEDGCMANEGSRRGCRVRNEVIWKAIDDLS